MSTLNATLSLEKSFMFTIALLWISLIGITACSDDNSADEGSGGGRMTATINGQSWEAVEVQAVYQNGAYAIVGTDIEAGDTQQINISGILNAEGTYPIRLIGGITATYSFATGPTDVNPQLGTSGELVIEELTSDKTSGTFTISGQGFNITNGSFSINF